MTDALAISAGISASPGERRLFPLKMLITLTKQYGDQLSMKAANAVAVRRKRFNCHRLRLSLMRSLSLTMSCRRSLFRKQKRKRIRSGSRS